MGQGHDARESHEFDGYHRWLGIPKREQPPDHYRLLGVSLFEDDLEVIANGADARLTTLRRQQSGPHAAQCTRLLNEVSQARLCLLNLDRKEAYDQRLNAALHPEAEADGESSFGDASDEFILSTSGGVSSSRPRSRNEGSPLGTIVGAVLGGVCAWLILWQLNVLPKELVGGAARPPLHKAAAIGPKGDQQAKVDPADGNRVPTNTGAKGNLDKGEPGKDEQIPFAIEGLLIEEAPPTAPDPQGGEPGQPASKSITTAPPPGAPSVPTISLGVTPPTIKNGGGIVPDKVPEAPGPRGLEFQLARARERDVAEALKKLEQDRQVAANGLLNTFGKVIGRVRLNKQLSSEVRTSLLASLDVERLTFMRKGRVPFSPTMRPALVQYMQEITTSEQRVYKAYELAITAFTNAKDPQKVAELLLQKHGVPRVVGKWQCDGTNFRRRFTYTLYSNFSVNPAVGSNIPYPHYWVFKGDSIVLNINPANRPNGGFKDTCTIHEDGQKLDARNQLGGKYVGRLID